MAEVDQSAKNDVHLQGDELARTYDATAFFRRGVWEPPPDPLATVATLAGMNPAPVERCRVLELGCASGGNLMPMAETLPQSVFLGIDLAAKQIEAGWQIIEAAGLRNLRIEALSILDLPDE